MSQVMVDLQGIDSLLELLHIFRVEQDRGNRAASPLLLLSLQLLRLASALNRSAHRTLCNCGSLSLLVQLLGRPPPSSIPEGDQLALEEHLGVQLLALVVIREACFTSATCLARLHSLALFPRISRLLQWSAHTFAAPTLPSSSQNSLMPPPPLPASSFLTTSDSTLTVDVRRIGSLRLARKRGRAGGGGGGGYGGDGGGRWRRVFWGGWGGRGGGGDGVGRGAEVDGCTGAGAGVDPGSESAACAAVGWGCRDLGVEPCCFGGEWAAVYSAAGRGWDRAADSGVGGGEPVGEVWQEEEGEGEEGGLGTAWGTARDSQKGSQWGITGAWGDDTQ
ncbi:hypothetical protein CLOP_g9416 [Closterium sp. NIES-67]|nr:hypothetical protein CLOP_g9416 [Closterium sp. NIES-67]